MGIGTNILGYSNNLVDKNVKKIVEDGNMSTLIPLRIFCWQKN